MAQELPLVERRLYTYPEVDRILDLTAGTAQRWINGYDRRGRAYEPVVRAESEALDSLVNWGEFIETYYLSRFRDEGIPLRRLRRILADIRERTESHYLFSDDRILHADPETLEVVWRIQEEYGVDVFMVVQTGQLRFELDEMAKKRLRRISYEEGIAHALRPRMDIDHVLVYADRFFGKPKIEDTGISPGAVARLVYNGTPVTDVAELYGLAPSLIREAGRFTYGDRWVEAA